MADKDIQMTQRNAANNGWDNLYPKTKAENIIGIANYVKNGDLSGSAFPGVYGGDWTTQIWEKRIENNETHLVFVTTQAADLSHAWYVGVFMVYCNVFGRVTAVLVHEYSAGVNIYFKTPDAGGTPLNTYTVMTDGGQQCPWTPAFNILKVE